MAGLHPRPQRRLVEPQVLRVRRRATRSWRSSCAARSKACTPPPRFNAQATAKARTIGAKSWAEGAALGHAGAIAYLADLLRGQSAGHELVAVGHRVVHGGMEFARPVRVDSGVLAALERSCPLAPLHQPHNLDADPHPLGAASGAAAGGLLRHGVPSQPAGGRAGVRAAGRDHREGRAALRLPRPLVRVHRQRAAAVRSEGCRRPHDRLRTSATAAACARWSAGKSVASTMGFTAVDGLPMGTRCGNVDPGVMLYLLDELRMDARAIEELIYRKSGLLGVSGVSSDMRVLLESERRARALRRRVVRLSHRPRARLARGGRRRHRRTGVHGRHRRARRADPRARLPRCRLARHRARCRRPTRPDGPRIGKPSSRASVWVIPTNEELMIARHTRALLAGMRP